MAKLSRRSILKGLAAAPVGAKQAANDIAEMAGVEIVGANAFPPVYGQSMSPTDTSSKLIEGLDLWGVPDFQRDEWKREARMSRVLDPDIAALRSLSLDAKLRKQWKRNEQHAEREFWRTLFLDRDRSKFLRKIGVWN
jgi:hypothetical protein